MKDVKLYTFKRYRRGREMAQGAKVYARSEAEALKKAKWLFPEYSCERDEYRLQEVTEA